jgi:DNA-binding PadR family transcriptional regulator
MAVPDTTSLQFLVMGTLLHGEESGQSVREELVKHGVRKSGPAFYQLMARMEDDGLVRGRYESYVINGQPIKERRYKLTAHGQRAWEKARDFYMQVAGLQGGFDHVRTGLLGGN